MMTTSKVPLEPPTPPKQIRWWMMISALIAIGLAISGVYLWMSSAVNALEELSSEGPESSSPLAIAKLKVDVIRNSLTVGAGLGGLFALILAFRRQYHTEHQQRHLEHTEALAQIDRERDYLQRDETARATERDALERRITDLRIQAISQLGSESAAVRIGGLHNLERLGAQHSELRQIVLDDICSYLRLPFDLPEPKNRPQIYSASNKPLFEPVGPLPEVTEYQSSVHRQEREVRRVAQSILQRHLNRLYKPAEYWEHERITLDDAVLDRVNFSHCEMNSASFSHAKFFGEARFLHAKFLNETIFSGAEFTGSVVFYDAKFKGVTSFRNARLEGSIVFSEAEFDFHTSFNSSEIFAYMDFVGPPFFYSLIFDETVFRGGFDLDQVVVPTEHPPVVREDIKLSFIPIRGRKGLSRIRHHHGS